LLQSILDRVRHERPQSSALPILVLYALALSAQGASERARALLADALPSAVAQGYVRTFVDEGAPMAALLGQVLIAGDTSGVEGVLAAFPQALLEESQASGVGRQSAAPLSAREVEVMRLMAAGLSNQQIADELVVALSTVRTHAKHI